MTIDLRPPGGLVEWLRAEDQQPAVRGQRILFNAEWWNDALAHHGFRHRFSTQELTRADVFSAGADSASDPEQALALLWSSVAWGGGSRVRNMKGRLASVAADRERYGALLRDAASASRADPGDAFRRLRIGETRNQIKYLGPAFFTKFLYFAGGGEADHPCLILDRRVAQTLRRSGWTGLWDGGWRSGVYSEYCELLTSWRDDLKLPRADLIEYWLFVDAPAASRTDDQQQFSREELESIRQWLIFANENSPDAAVDLQQITPKIDRLLESTDSSASADTDD